MTEDPELDEAFARTARKGPWSVFQTKHLKLHLVKQALNYFAKELLRMVPKREPERKVEKFVDEFFLKLVMIERKHARNLDLSDRNFYNLLLAFRRFLLFIMHEDGFYRTFVNGSLVVMKEMLNEVDIENIISEEDRRILQ